jgi:hypothetical protein
MNYNKPIAYAVDVETGRITWVLYERKIEHERKTD